MGIFSEANAESNAKKIEKIILNSIQNNSPDIIIDFIKDNLLDWYYEECGETWGSYSPSEQIINYFSDDN